MKPLSYTQKKWAMATLLLGALTFNLSMHTPSEVSQTDLASEDEMISAEIPTADGMLQVKYMRNGDEVMAAIPRTTQGRTCDACGQFYKLDINFEKNKGDLNALNIALLNTIAKSKDKKSEPNKEVSAKTDDEKKIDALAAKKARDRKSFAIAFDGCTPDSDTAKTSAGKLATAECFAKEYLNLVKRRDNSERSRIDKEVALKVFQTEIEPKFHALLTSSSVKVVSGAYGETIYDDSTKNVLLTLDTLKSGLPEAQNDVLAQAVSMERRAIQTLNARLRLSLEELKANPNDHSIHASVINNIRTATILSETMDSMNNPKLFQEGGPRNQQDLMRINRATINGVMLNSLQRAVEGNYISQDEALALYKREYNKNVTAIINGMTKSYTLQGGQAVISTDQMVLEGVQELRKYSPRIDVPQTNMITRAQLAPNALSGRTQIGPVPQQQQQPQPQFQQGLPAMRGGAFRN